MNRKERKRQEAEARRLQSLSGTGGSPNWSAPPAPNQSTVSITEVLSAVPTVLAESSNAGQAPAVEEPATAVDESSLRAAWKALKQAEENYRAGQKSLDEKLDRCEREQTQLKSDRESLSKERQLAESDRQRLAVKEAELLAEAESLARTRADAEAGFLVARRQSLQKLDEVVTRLTEDAAAQIEALAKRRKELIDDVAAAETSAAQEEWQKLETAKRDLARARRQLEWDTQDYEERRKADLEKNRATVAGQLERLESERLQLEGRLKSAREERDALFQEVDRTRRAAADLGDRSPDTIRQELERYRREVKALQDKLAQSPDPGVVEELQRVRGALEAQTAQMRERDMQLATQREALSRANIAVTELETIREERRVLGAHKQLLEAKLTDLQSRIDQFINGEAGRSPFPECRRMDEDRRRQTGPALRGQVPDLSRFVDDLQNRIAYQSSQRGGGRTLYYSKRDLRCFVGGLAMSPLHILQGISGTGKTSLPMAFADAVGAGSKLIAVQAGWRDRQDLLGHYNTFEKRYYETEFLQALYEAQTPEFSGRLYIIVLDEMNLSHPEQYAADLLSELEKPDPADRKVDLMTSQVTGAPKFFLDGRRVRLPENVWFVGTANHDETTKDFADKTYDRAHVMELPRHRESFEIKAPMDLEPLSLDGLQKSFTIAHRTHAESAKKVYSFLDRHFTGVLGDMFGVSWGNRLERQVSLFVPVVVAAGGSAVEALDHLVATKLLRKLRNRHDIRPEHYVKLRESLEKAPTAELATVPPAERTRAAPRPKEELVACLGLLNREIQRLGVDQER